MKNVPLKLNWLRMFLAFTNCDFKPSSNEKEKADNLLSAHFVTVIFSIVESIWAKEKLIAMEKTKIKLNYIWTLKS